MHRWMNEASEEDLHKLTKVCDNLRKIGQEQLKLLDYLAQKYCKFKIGDDVYHINDRKKIGTVLKVYHPEGSDNDSFYETGLVNPEPEIDAAIDIGCFGGGTRTLRGIELTYVCTREELIYILDVDIKCLRANLNGLGK